jgi:hypothetical protein
MAFADLARLVDGKLVFKGEEDHADGSNHLGHGDSANSPDAGLVIMKKWESLADIQRPGQETKASQNGSGRDAAKDVENEEGGNAVDGALDEDERPNTSNANAYPESGSAKRDAENERDGTREAALRESPRTTGKERESAKCRKDQEWESNGGPAAVNAVDEEGVSNERNGEWDRIQDTEAADTKAERREGRQEETGTDENGRLTDGGDPRVGEGVGVVPPSQVVELQHADGGEEEPEEPKKSASIAEAQI